jgi:hypothetical protein
MEADMEADMAFMVVTQVDFTEAAPASLAAAIGADTAVATVVAMAAATVMAVAMADTAMTMGQVS